jgi:threonine/homoserine/homoserine lactone efflux protein
VTQLPQRQDAASDTRRPPAVIAAVLLMVSVCAVWLFCATAFSVAMARTEAAAFLKYALAIPISGLCLFVAYMCAVSIHNAWRGTANRLQVPANLSFVLFALVVVRLLVERKLEFEPTMITPIVLGVMAAIALRLSSTPAARGWFDRRQG